MDSLEQTNELLNNTAIDKINTAKTLLPDEIINGTMKQNGQRIPVSLYMDKFLVSIVTESTTPEIIANIIKTKFMDKIELALSDEVKRARATQFVSTREDSSVMYSSTRTVGDEFIERAVLYMENDGMFQVGPNRKTMEQYYEIVLNNKSVTYTKEDQIETYKAYMESIFDKEMLNSKKVGTEKTVKEFILTELAATEEDFIYVTYNGQKMQIDEALVTIRQEQLEYVNTNVEMPDLKEVTEEEEQENTRSNEVPANVGQIIYRVEADKSVTVSTDTPFNPNKELTEEETYNMLTTHGNNDSMIITRLNQLMDMVTKTSSAHDLDNLEKEKNELVEEISSYVGNEYVITKFRTLEDLIVAKRNNIIKIDGNKEDYVDAIQGRLTSLQEELRDCQDPKKFDIINGELISIQREIQLKGIRDYELEAVIERITQDILLRRIKTDSLMMNQDKEFERLITEIDDRIKQIEQLMYEIKTNRNEASVAGVSVRVEREYNEIITLITESYRDEKISKDLYGLYIDKINSVVVLEQEEQRINRLG